MLSHESETSQCFANAPSARVLDEKLKKEGLGDKPIAAPGSSRKRQRQSQG
jgi:hypothetical protein